ncbi:MAG TPA: universal stress protein [Longimicrobiaceae bacterium]|nr:universal stress protein [Longimicrobiaceae bacterium]
MRPLALRTVVVATDLGDACLPAVRAAADLARLAGARMHAVHAADAPDAEAGRELGVHLRRAGVPPATLASARVERGSPERVIVERAARVEADAVVLGPHRAGGGLGSTADRVVRSAGAPCLVLPAPLPLPLGRVLAPVDLGAATRGSLLAALTWASALRRRPVEGVERTELCVLHVAGYDEDAEAAAAALHREVEEACSAEAGFAGVRVREAVERGDPAEAILRHARADASDLLVLGTRGRSGPGALLGSVSSAVVRGTPGPTLLVPPAVWRDHGAEPPLRGARARG